MFKKFNNNNTLINIYNVRNIGYYFNNNHNYMISSDINSNIEIEINNFNFHEVYKKLSEIHKEHEIFFDSLDEIIKIISLKKKYNEDFKNNCLEHLNVLSLHKTLIPNYYSDNLTHVRQKKNELIIIISDLIKLLEKKEFYPEDIKSYLKSKNINNINSFIEFYKKTYYTIGNIQADKFFIIKNNEIVEDTKNPYLATRIKSINEAIDICKSGNDRDITYFLNVDTFDRYKYKDDSKKIKENSILEKNYLIEQHLDNSSLNSLKNYINDIID